MTATTGVLNPDTPAAWPAQSSGTSGSTPSTGIATDSVIGHLRNAQQLLAILSAALDDKSALTEHGTLTWEAEGTIKAIQRRLAAAASQVEAKT
jgi:hypothetical protein